MPKTPFATRLSGRAKETELRLRSIFQWKKKRPPVAAIVLVALVVLLCFGLVSCESGVSDELRKNVEQWVSDYPWSEGSEAIDADTRWEVESVKRTDRNYDQKDIRGVIYEVECSSESGASHLTLTLLVDPDTLEIYPEPESWYISGKEDPQPARSEPAEDEKQGEANIAPINGETLSPDGNYEVRLYGVVDGVTSGGLAAAEQVQICDVKTGGVLWEDWGAYEHCVAWAPNSKKLALARTTRTACTVTIVETEQFSSWDVTLPGEDYWDQVAIPEYMFLPDNRDWFEWINSGHFRLTLGRGGDAGDRQDYYGGFYDDMPLNGYTMNMYAETVFAEYDLNHDGFAERLEKMSIRESEDGPVSHFVLYAFEENGTRLWEGTAWTSHAGWNTYFVCTLDGIDYLLQCTPVMYSGQCEYSYRLFYLDSDGGEVTVRENSVSFDLQPGWIGNPRHFDAEEIAAFADELNELLTDSRLLVTTDNAYRDIDPDAPYEAMNWIFIDVEYDKSKSILENLNVLDMYLALNTRI